MSKNRFQNIVEQIDKKGHASAPFHSDKVFYQTSDLMKSEDVSTKVAEQDSAIKLRAYQIHLEKGGSDLDNWLEAERSLKNDQYKKNTLFS